MSFGELVFTFEDKSSIPIQVSSTSQSINYDVEKTTLKVSFPNLANAVGSNLIEIALTDDSEQQNVYKVNLIIKALIPEPEPVVEIIPVEDTRILKNVTATMESITSTGEMLIRFNTEMKTEAVNLTFLNSSIIDIYI